MPQVSVVVPNYNHARFLSQRFESILGQTFQDFELIVLDDASTDDSKQVIARHAADPRVRVIANEVNSGSPFKQWNRGVQEARCDLVWIAESDDYADPRLLETLVDRLTRHPKVGLAYCQSMAVNEAGELLGSEESLLHHIDPVRWKSDYVEDGRVECARYLSRLNPILNASAVVFRKGVFEQAGCADPSMRLCGDWLTWLNMLLLADVAYVAEPLNFHRTHLQSARDKYPLDRSAEERWRIASRIFEAVPMEKADLERLKERLSLEFFYVLAKRRKFGWGLEWGRKIYALDPWFVLRLPTAVASLAARRAGRLANELLANPPKQ